MRRSWLCGVVLIGALSATACLPKGVRLPQSPLLSVLERKSGWIAYVGTDGNVYVTDQTGGESRALTEDATLSGDDRMAYVLPTWSPDGQQVAVIRYRDSVSADEHVMESSIWVIGRDQAQSVSAYSSTEVHPFYLYWSPDGQWISFLATLPQGDNLLLQMVPPGDGQAVILDAGQPVYWSWAPDARSMLVHVGGQRGSNSAARMAVLRVDPSADPPVVEEGLDQRPSNFLAPQVSADGSRWLFAAELDDGSPALVVADASGQAQRVVTTYRGSIAFALSPDNRRVAYIVSEDAQSGGVGPLSIVDLEGEQEPITINESVMAFFWAPDGRQLATFVPSAAPVEGEASEGQDVELRLSLSVLDVASGDSRPVAIFTPTPEFLYVLPYFDQYHRSTTLWSPDSNNLVLSGFRGDGTPGIWVASASGNIEPRFLTEGILGFWSAQ